jgi:predicted porin
MNTKLLITTVGAALVAGPMLAAQADTSFYGHLHMSFDSVDNGTSKSGFVSSNLSRFGIKGNEDLGGGLKAIYQVESPALRMDDGSGGLGGTMRNTYLGFAGSSWGALKVGRYDTPFKELGRKLETFNDELGDMINIFSGSLPAASNYDARVSNMIRYESPDMGGVTVNALHTSNDGTEGPGGTGNSVNSLSANWSAGPAFVGAAYQKRGYSKTLTVTQDHDSAWRLAGSYDFSGVVLGLIYQDLKDINGADLSQKLKGLTASYKLANNLVKFHYLTVDDLSGSACSPCNSTGGKLWALGVDHSFSKSTLVYVNYANAKNDSNTKAYSVISGNAGQGENDLPTVNGKTVKGIAAGMVLNF